MQAISDLFHKAEQQVTPDSCGASLYHGVMRHFLLELREVRPQMIFWMSVERRGKYRQPRKRVPRWGAAPSNPNHLELILAISTAVQRHLEKSIAAYERQVRHGRALHSSVSPLLPMSPARRSGASPAEDLLC